ncbi:patatin-like phospholipase family protein, partial [bacterium]|nr:patatin-like phospholipase family protein [bacterium]
MKTNKCKFWICLIFLFATFISANAQETKPRPRIGLVLSGGGARGFAHIGVLQWFEEHRIPVDYLAGTSMGGLIGGMYSIGLTPDEMKDIAYNINWIDLFRPVPAYDTLDFRRKEDRRAYPNGIELGLRNGIRLPPGLNSGHQLGLLFSRLTLPYSRIQSFDELPIPFRCIATDMVEAKQVVLSKGSLALALQATMSIPGVFAPVEIDGEILASDGGLLNNIPTDVMKSLAVDTVIAVDIGTPLGGRESMGSLGSILGQTIGVVTIENVRRNKKLADILIEPDLKKFETMDFPRAREITSLGYEGAEKMSSKLLPYAVGEAEWQAYLNERQSRIKKDVPNPQFIEVKGTTENAAEKIEFRLKNFVDQPLDPLALNKQLTEIWGRGRFLGLGYQLADSNGQTGLLIRVREKNYAPPFLNVALELNNTSTDELDVNLRGRVTLMDIGSQGSEVRLDGSLGSETSIAGEYFYRVSSGNFFVAPRAFTQKTKLNLFLDEEQIAQYSIREYAVAADVGYEFGTTDQIRLGYQGGHISASRSIGDPVLPEVSGRRSLSYLSWHHDSVDNAVIPTHGFLINTEFRYVIDSPILEGSDLDSSLPQFLFRGAAFIPAGPKNTLFAIGEGDTSFGKHPTVTEQFTIGG